MSQAIQCADLRLSFAKQEVLRGMSLDVEQGESLVILGPSGCGKTTFLRALAGLERPDGGSIALQGQPVFHPDLFVEPAERRVGFVFQDLGLWPSMTVLDHLLFVLGPGAADRKNRAMARLCDLKIDHLAKKKPAQLSGGEAQRVALARALVSDPDLLFLDEPLSSLDPVIAADIRRLLARIHREEKRTMIYVTHSRDEAFELADRVLLMRSGQVEQLGTPAELAAQPGSVFAAQFLGLGNLIKAELDANGEAQTILGRHQAITRSETSRSCQAYVGRRAVKVVPDGPITARVESSRFLGDDWTIEVSLDGEQLEFRHDQSCEPGTTVHLQGPAEVWCLGNERGEP